MEAILFDEQNSKASGINLKRCIGCGLCVATCNTGSIKLKKKDTKFIPPKDFDALYEVLMRNKKGMLGKLAHFGKSLFGMKA